MAWEQFWTLSKLDVVVTGAQQSDAAKIYANGRNLVQAIITVQLLDKSGQAINVSDADLHAALYMCHFETGEKLSSSWLIANDPNDYVIQPTAPRENPPVGANVRQISKYIGCSDQNLIEITQKIAVGINVPNVGEFDTSSNGTSTRAPSGQVFKSPKSVSITALRPIDYRNHNNIQIVCGEFDTLRSNLQWVARFSTAGPFYDHTDAECKRRIAYIRPNKANTGQEKFKEHSIEYKPVGNGDVSTGTCEWYWDTGSEATFSVVKQAGGVGLPGAVIGRGAGRGDFQVNMWYSRKNRIVLNGKVYVEDCGSGSYYHRFNGDGNQFVDEDHNGDDEDGAATLLLYKVVIPTKDTQPMKWKNVFNAFTVKVTDYYGNDGSFQLVFNDGDQFDQPGLQ